MLEHNTDGQPPFSRINFLQRCCCIALLYITTKLDGSKNCRVPNNKATGAEEKEEEEPRTCRVAEYDNSNNYR
jgi:hypothetical protein